MSNFSVWWYALELQGINHMIKKPAGVSNSIACQITTAFLANTQYDFHVYMFDFIVLSIHVFECFNTLQTGIYKYKYRSRNNRNHKKQMKIQILKYECILGGRCIFCCSTASSQQQMCYFLLGIYVRYICYNMCSSQYRSTLKLDISLFLSYSCWMCLTQNNLKFGRLISRRTM